MNTPPKIKRYTRPIASRNVMTFMAWQGLRIGQIHGGLSNPKYGVMLARIVTEFEHLEDHMAKFLAELVGTDQTIAGYILRAIKAPRGRKDIMTALLELAERNQSLGPEYDQVIAEFHATAGLRNTYVHGRWWTSAKGNLLLFAPTDEQSLEIMRAQPARMVDLNYVLYRIHRTAVLVTRLTIVRPEDRAQLPALPPLDPPPPKDAGHPKARAKVPPSRPSPSKRSPAKKGNAKTKRKPKP